VFTGRYHRDTAPSKYVSRPGVEFSHDYTRWNLAGEGDTRAFSNIGMTWSTLTLAVPCKKEHEGDTRTSFHTGMTWSTSTLTMPCKKEHIALPYTASICSRGNLHTLISMQHK
jgi:hypothetical protein